MLVRAARAALKQSSESFLSNKGVTCFSEINDDLLMWSHYGDKCKGICLEFDTRFEPFSKVRRVSYVPALPEINVHDILVGRDFDPVLQLYCTKSAAWSYEREWRAIHNVAGTLFGYSSQALTGVYFGPDIDSQSVEIVCLVLGGQNETVRYFEGARSTTEFKVLFRQFTYTSYLEAKRMGLRS